MDQVLIFNEAHLRRLVKEYICYSTTPIARMMIWRRNASNAAGCAQTDGVSTIGVIPVVSCDIASRPLIPGYSPLIARYNARTDGGTFGEMG